MLFFSWLLCILLVASYPIRVSVACSRVCHCKSNSNATAAVVFFQLSSPFSSFTTDASLIGNVALSSPCLPPTFRATATATAPVLIAVASWDSPSVVVFSFTAPPSGNVAEPQTGPDGMQRTSDPFDKGTAVAEELATWLPPWGASAGGAGAAGARGGSATILTRALAFVRSGKGPERMSLVAATGDGSVAVAVWQGAMVRGRPGVELRGRFVSVASFQIGRGPVRLETFLSPGRARMAKAGGERLFVNGSSMDAVLYYRGSDADEAAAPDECRGGWRCTQVSSAICATNKGCLEYVSFL